MSEELAEQEVTGSPGSDALINKIIAIGKELQIPENEATVLYGRLLVVYGKPITVTEAIAYIRFLAAKRLVDMSVIDKRILLSAGILTRKRDPKKSTKNIGRNEPCPCGSKKKYKHCCINNVGLSSIERTDNGS